MRMTNRYKDFTQKELEILFQNRIGDLARTLKWMGIEVIEQAFAYKDRAHDSISSYCLEYHGLTKHNGEWQLASLIDHIDRCQEIMNDLGLILEANQKRQEQEESEDDS